MYVVHGRAERRGYSQNDAAVVSIVLTRRALDGMSTWPGYAHTPLRSLLDWAAELGGAEVLSKDEASRFGCGGLEALGRTCTAEPSIKKAPPAGTGSASVIRTPGDHDARRRAVS